MQRLTLLPSLLRGRTLYSFAAARQETTDQKQTAPNQAEPMRRNPMLPVKQTQSKSTYIDDLKRDNKEFEVKQQWQHGNGRLEESDDPADNRWRALCSHQSHWHATLSEVNQVAGNGRSLEVGKALSLARAWKRLTMLVVAENGLRREQRLNARYEKPTQQRKRLASERHRRRFKHAVARRISAVMRLKKRGL